MIFAGAVEFRQVSQDAFQIAASGSWRLSGLTDAFRFLRQHSGWNREINPFEAADSTSWVILTQLLS